MSTGFHLPHNAILPEEVKFIISLIDPNKEYYLYDDLKAMMFEEEIRHGVFEKFHPGMFKNFMKNERLKPYYDKVLSGELNYADIKKFLILIERLLMDVGMSNQEIILNL